MNQRYYSLDVFRGATVALMIMVNNPGSWKYIYAPLEHASWHGLTPTDLVFPFFLFAVGNAMAFVMPRLEAQGNAVVWRKIIKRSLLIFAIGLFLNWYPFIRYDDSGALVAKPFENLRIFGVLQRIAVAYFFASVIVHLAKPRMAFFISLVILLFYWFLCVAANPADPFSIEGWFGTNIDKFVLGESHMYHGEGIAFDPEGIMSSFAPVSEVIFGYLAGTYIIQRGKTPEMLNGLFIAGCALLFTAYIWNMSFPINKKIWTSSFTVCTSGLALLILALMIYAIEFRNMRSGVDRFFNVFGRNPLFIYALSGLLPRTLGLIHISNGVDETTGKPKFLTPLSWFYEHICKNILPYDARIGSLVYALCFIGLMWFFAWLLDHRKIYIRV